MIAGWLWVGLAWAGAQDGYEAGIAALRSGESEVAVSHFLQSLQDGGESPAVYHGLGNALYREDHRGHAMAAWRRGLRLQPGNPDLAANVQRAQQENQDQQNAEILGVGPFVWLRWMSARLCGILASACATAGIAGAWIARVRRRGIGVAAGLLLLALVLSISVWQVEHAGRTAIVVVPEVTVSSTPGEGGVTLFALHEGTEVRMVEQGDNGMQLVALADGRKGWLSSRAVQSTSPGDAFWIPWTEE